MAQDNWACVFVFNLLAWLVFSQRAANSHCCRAAQTLIETCSLSGLKTQKTEFGASTATGRLDVHVGYWMGGSLEYLYASKSSLATISLHFIYKITL